MKMSTVYATTKTLMISPKKVAIVLDLVRGKSALEAKTILTFDPTKAAKMALKTLKSAIANAKNNLQLPESTLFVSEIHVSGGPLIKRGRIVARGRFSPVIKRTSHIVVGLSERKAN
jgi:large subunit ribosomal protein L22